MQSLSKLLARILASGGPRVQLARVRWPMHLALSQTWQQAARHGELGLFDPPLEFGRSARVGHAALGADQALEQLIALDVLRPQGEMRQALLVFDDAAAVMFRRQLMALPPAQVSQLQFAGARWAAFASTALKNRSTAARSPASTVRSSTPKRANLSLPGSD